METKNHLKFKTVATSSYRHRFLQNAVTYTLSQPLFRHNVNLSPEQAPEVHQQSAEVKKAPAGFQVHEKIDITVPLCIAPRHRTKDTNVVRPA